jgi:hypothetical protein
VWLYNVKKQKVGIINANDSPGSFYIIRTKKALLPHVDDDDDDGGG